MKVVKEACLRQSWRDLFVVCIGLGQSGCSDPLLQGCIRKPPLLFSRCRKIQGDKFRMARFVNYGLQWCFLNDILAFLSLRHVHSWVMYLSMSPLEIWASKKPVPAPGLVHSISTQVAPFSLCSCFEGRGCGICWGRTSWRFFSTSPVQKSRLQLPAVFHSCRRIVHSLGSLDAAPSW